MAEGDVHVTFKGRRWIVEREGDFAVALIFRRKRAAWDEAEEIAKREQVGAFLHARAVDGADGDGIDRRIPAPSEVHEAAVVGSDD